MENVMPKRKSKVITLEEAASWVKDGMILAIAGAHMNNSLNAFVREIVRRRVKDLTMIPSNTTGYQTDIFTHFHTPRLYVEKVDFISGPGYLDGPGAREKAGCPQGGGPRYVITPICIFDFDDETKMMHLKSVHPGTKVEEVMNKTGFTPIVPENVPKTEPPTVEEVAFMRAMDPDGVLPKQTR
jgi:acyl CoA:acetate/3-ketoacid CoA transferase